MSKKAEQLLLVLPLFHYHHFSEAHEPSFFETDVNTRIKIKLYMLLKNAFCCLGGGGECNVTFNPLFRLVILFMLSHYKIS